MDGWMDGWMDGGRERGIAHGHVLYSAVEAHILYSSRIVDLDYDQASVCEALAKFKQPWACLVLERRTGKRMY